MPRLTIIRVVRNLGYIGIVIQVTDDVYAYNKVIKNRIMIMVSREKIMAFINRAHDIACSHGFHDVEMSEEHWLMLVISEIAEVVEADRKNLHANPTGFDKCIGIEYSQRFKDYVKDSVEDELADVCIRLFDYCGEFGLVPLMFKDGVLEMHEEFKRIFMDKTICEKCFTLSALVMDISRKSDGDDSEKEYYLGMILSFCFEFAHFYGFDLCWHVEQKMEYNDSRPRKHGKKY